MPATSQAQQKFFALVRAHQEGKVKHVSSKIKEVAKSVSKKDAHDFAATPIKDLPERVEKKALFKQAFIDQAQSYGFVEKDANSLLNSALE